MDSHDQQAGRRQAAAMSALFDQLQAVMVQFDKEDHGGERCQDCRINAISYLANALGLEADDPNDVAKFIMTLAMYNQS